MAVSRTQVVRLLEKQREDLKAFTEGLLKDIFKEIQDGKECVFNRTDGLNDDINQLGQQKSKSEELQGWKSSAEENFEVLEMETGVSESFGKQGLRQELIIFADQFLPDEDTLIEKAYSYFKAETHKRISQKIHWFLLKEIILKELSRGKKLF